MADWDEARVNQARCHICGAARMDIAIMARGMFLGWVCKACRNDKDFCIKKPIH